mgnify:CR=1 FL=1
MLTHLDRGMPVIAAACHLQWDMLNRGDRRHLKSFWEGGATGWLYHVGHSNSALYFTEKQGEYKNDP